MFPLFLPSTLVRSYRTLDRGWDVVRYVREERARRSPDDFHTTQRQWGWQGQTNVGRVVFE
jgi:hypothetical protein